mgnify:CR=1 FL=1
MEHQKVIQQICADLGNDPKRMMDILWTVQDRLGCIAPASMGLIADLTHTQRVVVEGVVSFYAFFHQEVQGQNVIYLCEDIIDQHAGFNALKETVESCLGIQPGQMTKDGLFSFYLAPSIGMCDQAPAALINQTPVTKLTPTLLKRIINNLRKGKPVAATIPKLGDGNNSHPLIQSMVQNNVRKQGEVLLSGHQNDEGLSKALSLSPAEVIDYVLKADLKGRGGAGYRSAEKWKIAADTPAKSRFLICNADEGEPGTFKDRLLLTERAHQLIEGMTIAAYAIEATQGILYLRAEYRYLQPYLESVLSERRQKALLGENISDTDFDFDIRIQLGAGAYICGEESALISSCEGKRGEPTTKPPFPAVYGYLGLPTIVNNVETFCNLPPILAKGSDWFRSIGTEKSKGTKLLSVCGDCDRPGIYELPMGIKLSEVLSSCGALNTEAVQVGGASGVLIGRSDFDRQLCFEDLPTAGAIMIFNSQRNILKIVNYFMHFFIEESCGYCTPCRVGNVFLKERLDKIMNGLGEPADLEYLRNLSATVRETSRCGLGHTSPNPILSSMENFPLVYAALLKEHPSGEQAGFNIQKALDESRIIAKRRSLIYDPDFSSGEGRGNQE